ncbi:MAG: hypothetical protein SF097_15375 [Acidobacteriota bacterium]|nr:hypothetical protein [Acidobacteriota bacterium]
MSIFSTGLGKLPEKLLGAALRWMPEERSEWGAAMLAELAHLQHPRARWQFAWGCARVALFPPRRVVFRMNDRMKHWRTTFGTAALFSFLIVVVNTFLLFMTDNPETHPGLHEFQFYLDFFRGWFLNTLVLTLIVSGLRASQSTSMKHWLIPLSTATLFGLLLIAPFAFMEYWNNPGIRSGEFAFPFVLFFGLWLSPALFFLAATPIVRRLRAGEAILAHPIPLLLRVAFLAFLVLGWVSLLRDQMPCFRGVPNCD